MFFMVVLCMRFRIFTSNGAEYLLISIKLANLQTLSIDAFFIANFDNVRIFNKVLETFKKSNDIGNIVLKLQRES